MPLSAVTGKAEIMDGPHPAVWAGTYSVIPWPVSPPLKAIGMIRQPEFLERATQIGDRIRNHLPDLQAKSS